ncbi:hypothetical protein I7I53_02924 [Histoplasma capsulatum var. duboisii H88]|uniref:Uncharacterized protein n=1 Tax=Ajellomyces capsulatus (strain H88) TaxID=544711 RepID=A0A8A1LNY9_AJEC8|nr:hypothetical protein I7I53_02924 [Histoplasma capsulatum var. duboisii H88]
MSYTPHTLAAMPNAPTILSGTPTPSSKLQCTHRGNQARLFTRLFFHLLSLSLCRSLCGSNSRSSSLPPSPSPSPSLSPMPVPVPVPMPVPIFPLPSRPANTYSLHTLTNSNSTCPNHARVLHAYHLPTDPHRSTARRLTTPFAARCATFSSTWYTTLAPICAYAIVRSTGSAGGAARVSEPQDQSERRPRRRIVVRVSEIKEERARRRGCFGCGGRGGGGDDGGDGDDERRRMERKRVMMERSGGERRR